MQFAQAIQEAADGVSIEPADLERAKRAFKALQYDFPLIEVDDLGALASCML